MNCRREMSRFPFEVLIEYLPFLTQDLCRRHQEPDGPIPPESASTFRRTSGDAVPTPYLAVRLALAVRWYLPYKMFALQT